MIQMTCLLAEVRGVFEFLRSCYDALPVAVQLLIVVTFGGMLYISVLRSFRG